MDEAQHIDRGDSLDYISQVFVAISKYMQKEVESAIVPSSPNEAAKILILAPIFPIQFKDSTKSFDDLKTAMQTEMWFIADREHLRQSFEGLVPLLALNVNTVENIHTLLERLGLKPRLLSQVANGVPKIHGLSIPCPEYTASLRGKSRFISRYVFWQKSVRFLSVFRILIQTLEFFRNSYSIESW